jgi:hypothetical protein
MSELAASDIMEAVIAKGDLSKLTADERIRYYNETCRSMGLNPLTQPFAYITLNGKLTLYATRACADQLRKVNGVSLEIVSREVADDVLTVHVRARLPDGRVDEDLGAVAFPSTLKGEARANAELKGVTKAKRRATLSICGLGWLDETEIADIPARAKGAPIPVRNVMLPTVSRERTEHDVQKVYSPNEARAALEAAERQDAMPVKARPFDAETGEIEPGSDDKTAAEWDVELGEAAKEGMVALQDVWLAVPAEHKPTLKTALDKRHKIMAASVDAERAPAAG